MTTENPTETDCHIIRDEGHNELACVELLLDEVTQIYEGSGSLHCLGGIYLISRLQEIKMLCEIGAGKRPNGQGRDYI